MTPRSVALVANGASKGLITAKKSGSTTIRASGASRTGTASLSVSR